MRLNDEDERFIRRRIRDLDEGRAEPVVVYHDVVSMCPVRYDSKCFTSCHRCYGRNKYSHTDVRRVCFFVLSMLPENDEEYIPQLMFRG